MTILTTKTFRDYNQPSLWDEGIVQPQMKVCELMTSFDPPIQYFNEHKNKFSCMIYLTDGEAPAPVDPIQGKILWVLSSKSGPNNQLMPQIKLN
jgi:predicted metal-dependent peptidase